MLIKSHSLGGYLSLVSPIALVWENLCSFAQYQRCFDAVNIGNWYFSGKMKGCQKCMISLDEHG